MELDSILWYDAESDRLEEECAAMQIAAPALEWRTPSQDALLPAGGWVGRIRDWPFERPRPSPGLERLIGDPLMVRIELNHGFPASAPKFWPIVEPEPEFEYRMQQQWHINGDGSLCLMQGAHVWTSRNHVADLVPKASGWWVEYRLMKVGIVEHMTISGLNSDGSLDDLIRGFPRCRLTSSCCCRAPSAIQSALAAQVAAISTCA